MSCRVSAVSASSAMISPTTEQNLKPWPEKPAATTACGQSGWRSRRKCSSGLFSKRQVLSRPGTGRQVTLDEDAEQQLVLAVRLAVEGVGVDDLAAVVVAADLHP